MAQKQHEFEQFQAVHPIRCETPYSRWSVLHIGVLTVFFSYTLPVAFEYIEGVQVKPDLEVPSRKHINMWRDYSAQKLCASTEEFDSLLRQAIHQESTALMEATVSSSFIPQDESQQSEVEKLDDTIEAEYETDDELDDEDDDELDEDDLLDELDDLDDEE